MSFFSMNPVCALCHVGRPTVLCVAFVEQGNNREYWLSVGPTRWTCLYNAHSPCVCVFLCECDNSNVWTDFNEICIDGPVRAPGL